MQRISRATDNIFYQATRMTGGPDEDPGLHDDPPESEPYDESFTPEQLDLNDKMYHEGHKEGTHHREIMDFHERNGDPLSAIEALHDHVHNHDVTKTVLNFLSQQSKEPDHVKHAGSYWYSQGYRHGRGGDYDYTGFVPNKYGVIYSPPRRDDPMNRNGPWG